MKLNAGIFRPVIFMTFTSLLSPVAAQVEGWNLGAEGQTCAQVCGASLTCNANRLNQVDTREEIVFIADKINADGLCTTSALDSIPYKDGTNFGGDFMPSIGNGCFWDTNGGNDCSGSFDGIQRFCCCVADGSNAATVCPTGPGWFKGNLEQSCVDVCDTAGFSCDAGQLNAVDSAAKTEAVAGELGEDCFALDPNNNPRSPGLFDGLCTSSLPSVSVTCEASSQFMERFCCCVDGIVDPTESCSVPEDPATDSPVAAPPTDSPVAAPPTDSPVATPICDTGIFSSPNFPAGYPHSLNEVTTLCPKPGFSAVEVEFSHFSLESNDSCSFDYLRIFDSDGTDEGNALRTDDGGTVFCWDRAASSGTLDLVANGPIMSSNPSGCLTFQFVSDGSVNRPGFQAIVDCEAVTPQPSSAPVPAPSPATRIALITSTDNPRASDDNLNVELDFELDSVLTTGQTIEIDYFDDQACSAQVTGGFVAQTVDGDNVMASFTVAETVADIASAITESPTSDGNVVFQYCIRATLKVDSVILDILEVNMEMLVDPSVTTLIGDVDAAVNTPDTISVESVFSVVSFRCNESNEEVTGAVEEGAPLKLCFDLGEQYPTAGVVALDGLTLASVPGASVEVTVNVLDSLFVASNSCNGYQGLCAIELTQLPPSLFINTENGANDAVDVTVTGSATLTLQVGETSRRLRFNPGEQGEVVSSVVPFEAVAKEEEEAQTFLGRIFDLLFFCF